MAFIKGPGSWNKEEDQTSGVIGGGGGMGGEAAAGATPVNSSWTNLQQYLTANERAGAGIAKGITGTVQGEIDSIGQKRNEFEQKALSSIDQNTKKDNYSSQIQTDPTKINNQEYSAWKNLSNYMGPKSAENFDGYGDVQGGVSKAKENVDTANTFEGQQALANRAFGKQGGYTNGMSLLDTFVGAADSTGKQTYQDFQASNAGLGQGWQDTQARVNAGTKNADKAGQDAYDQVMKSIGTKMGSINTDAQTRANNNTDKSKAYEALQASDRRGLQASTNILDKFVSKKSDWGAADEYTDADIAALNQLSGMDDDEATKGASKRNSGGAYNSDADSYKAYLDKLLGGYNGTTSANQSAPNKSALVLKDIGPGSTPPPSANDPLPVPVKTGPTPPTPTPPITIGPSATPAPTAGSILAGAANTVSGNGNPLLQGKINTAAARPWPKTPPPGFPMEDWLQLQSFPYQGQFDKYY